MVIDKLTVKNPTTEVFRLWKSHMVEVVGEGNVSSKKSSNVAKLPYARIHQNEIPGARWTLEGDEAALRLSYNVEIFADTEEIAYAVDAESHRAMTQMGFRRVYGPVPIDNIDPSIDRLVSQYTRLYTGSLN